MDSYASCQMSAYNGNAAAFGSPLTTAEYLKGQPSYSYQPHPFSAGSFPR